MFQLEVLVRSADNEPSYSWSKDGDTISIGEAAYAYMNGTVVPVYVAEVRVGTAFLVAPSLPFLGSTGVSLPSDDG